MSRRSSLALVMFLSLTACASVPSKQSVHVTPDSELKISQMAHVGIIVDVCLFRDVIGDDDYWVVQESKSAASHMLEAARTSLVAKGFEVNYAEAPFVGAFKNREQQFKVSDKSGGEVTDKFPPLYESEGLAGNPTYREALLNIIPRIPSSRNLQDICCSNADAKDHMTVIAGYTGSDATLFLIGHGTIVSTGKQLTQGLATGLITAVLTLGTVSIVSYNVSFMDTYAVLVDNNTGGILWSNSVRLKGDGFTDQPYYDAEKWPKSILHYFPSKITERGDSTAASAIDEKTATDKDTAAAKPSVSGEDKGVLH